MKFGEIALCWVCGLEVSIDGFTEIILCMRPANERRRYIVTSYLIGWAHIQYDVSFTMEIFKSYPTILLHLSIGLVQLTSVFSERFNSRQNATFSWVSKW